jgi:DNA polymerase/3'-5' exonuclease PolX
MKVFELLYLLNDIKSFLQKSSVQLNGESFYKKPSVEKFKSIAYDNVIKKINDIYDQNKSLTKSDIHKLNITDHMKNKLESLLEHKINPSELQKIKKNQLMNELIDLAGIGKSKAVSLIQSGLTCIRDLKKKKYADQLPDATILLMKYNPDRKIPNADIKKIEKSLTAFPHSQLLGGFRRKKPFSKDIDVMVVSNKKSVLDDYLEYLEKKFSEIHIYAKGKDKVSLIVKINPKKYYKIDIFRSPVTSKYAMMLYGTGSKEFNIRMRSHASKLGYILNQNGLYKKGSKTPFPVKSEIDFFNKLNMDYIEPSSR